MMTTEWRNPSLQDMIETSCYYVRRALNKVFLVFLCCWHFSLLLFAKPNCCNASFLCGVFYFERCGRKWHRVGVSQNVIVNALTAAAGRTKLNGSLRTDASATGSSFSRHRRVFCGVFECVDPGGMANRSLSSLCLLLALLLPLEGEALSAHLSRSTCSAFCAAL